MQGNDEERAATKPPEHIQNPTRLYVAHLEGHSFRCIKALAPYDTDMPKGMADKICDANVRSDILVTPAVKTYLIKHFEIENEKELNHLAKKSIQKALLFLYNI